MSIILRIDNMVSKLHEAKTSESDLSIHEALKVDKFQTLQGLDPIDAVKLVSAQHRKKIKAVSVYQSQTLDVGHRDPITINNPEGGGGMYVVTVGKKSWSPKNKKDLKTTLEKLIMAYGRSI